EEQEPRIYLIKYTFDMDPAVWRRLPTVSDYRFYYDSTINDVLMELSEDGDINIAVPKDDKGSKTYNGIKEIRYTGFDLVSLNSRDKVKTMIFDELKKL
ncbi:MAG TPA: hypothetical protein DDY49_00175, partial [Paenibacillaceae bacterium]|nr:hypothetical protein [Paenibacillaceae bacterium]